jgi:hypothetical protein
MLIKFIFAKMRVTVCVFLVLLSVFATLAGKLVKHFQGVDYFEHVFTEENCGENESYTTCGSFCPPTCEKSGPRICVDACKSGCFCNTGYVKNSNGKCVTKDKC